MKRIAIINGPNLNLVGIREPDIYGDVSFDEFIPSLKWQFPELKISYFQSNSEGAIIDFIHDIGFKTDGLIVNAGAYTHTSIAIADALRSIPCSKVEVHLSNIYKREPFRHHSYIKDACQHSIVGKGMKGYTEALEWLVKEGAS